MPIYEFQCLNCGMIHDSIFKVNECPEEVLCTCCGHVARKILSLSVPFSETPTWIDYHLRNAIQGDGERPITTRGELAAYCKEKDIVPVG